MLFCTSNSIG
ncbi:hypothetical protein EC960932_5449, partial [Escherichia coli 96.0932]